MEVLRAILLLGDLVIVILGPGAAMQMEAGSSLS